jgi:hypothetical protein
MRLRVGRRYVPPRVAPKWVGTKIGAFVHRSIVAPSQRPRRRAIHRYRPPLRRYQGHLFVGTKTPVVTGKAIVGAPRVVRRRRLALHVYRPPRRRIVFVGTNPNVIPFGGKGIVAPPRARRTKLRHYKPPRRHPAFIPTRPPTVTRSLVAPPRRIVRRRKVVARQWRRRPVFVPTRRPVVAIPSLVPPPRRPRVRRVSRKIRVLVRRGLWVGSPPSPILTVPDIIYPTAFVVVPSNLHFSVEPSTLTVELTSSNLGFEVDGGGDTVTLTDSSDQLVLS